MKQRERKSLKRFFYSCLFFGLTPIDTLQKFARNFWVSIDKFEKICYTVGVRGFLTCSPDRI